MSFVLAAVGTLMQAIVTIVWGNLLLPESRSAVADILRFAERHACANFSTISKAALKQSV